jgi:retinol dehydrogenase 12
MTNSLVGKTYLVTGATSGIGLSCAEILAERGARVLGVGRSKERCFAAEQRLRNRNPEADHYLFVADLSLQSEIRKLTNLINGSITQLDGLVNNAGTFTYWQEFTQEGFETQWAVNHLAPFILSCSLLPLLSATNNSRVVNVSSDSHYFGQIDWEDPQQCRHYNGLKAYGNTKLANVLFTTELNRRNPQVRAFAADPGLVKTEIGFKGTPPLVQWIWNLRRSSGITAEESARGIVFLLTEPSIHDSPEVYWRHGTPRPSSKSAQDVKSAARLWELSEQMCSITGEEVKYETR